MYLFGKIVPTPFVPFAVQRLRADFGIMITASHNPKEDNGYKVYGSNGCQIRSPAEEHISAKIEKKNRRLWDISHELENVEDPFNFISEVYYENIKKLFCPKPSGIRIIYTPMHGVGKAYVDALFSSCEIPALDSVPRQAKPDPEFPSVKFPNPEEGKGALQPAMEYADSKSSRVIFANDPDADRFNVAEKNSNGSWRIFNGNEIALLLADYAWKRFGSTVNPERYVMIASLVSSRILAKMAAKEGFDFQQAATGFKNISNLGQELEAQGKKVLFAYEEAIGFMVGTTVWDKDGISALLAMYMIVSDLASQQLTISDHLESLYDRYGFPIQFNSYYYGGKAVGIMPELVKSLELVKNGQLFGDFEVESFEFQKSSKVVFLCFTNDTWLAIRASGTEPKVKFYSEMLVESKELVLKFQPSLEVAVKEVCELLLRPGLNNLTLKEE